MACETAPRPRANRVVEDVRIEAAAETPVEEYEGSDAVDAPRLVGLDRRGVLWMSEGRRGPGTSAS